MKIFIFLLIAFLVVFQTFFHLRAEKKHHYKINQDKSIIGQNNLAFLYGIIEPWKTKYCWTSVIQIIALLILIFYFKF